ncbi:MAG: hypothetical protein NTY15_20735 [Planctomycetota bacterium]|nr:hypothetical protein [Planctomycetota bacterium]
MKLVRSFFGALFTVFPVCVLSLNGAAQDFEIRLIENSKTLSQAVAINTNLDVIGTREVTEGPITSFRGFFRRGDIDVEFGLPKTYTNLEPCALSENGVVAGYVSRQSGSDKSMLGFVWDSRTQAMQLLQPLSTDTICQAQDISADGKIVSGYSTGSNPARTRPCVWELTEGSTVLVPRELSSIIVNSPFLQGGRVLISPDGKRVAGCIAEEQLSPIDFNSSLFVWEHADNGEWVRRKISDEQPKLKDMNNEGTVVGSLKIEGILRACVVNFKGKITLIDLLRGDESNEAYGITSDGMVVGLSDDPTGGEGGPTAFVFKDGVVSPLLMSKKTIHSAALGISESGAICGYLAEETDGEDGGAFGFIRLPGGTLKDKPKVETKERAK